jgi:hypothetical protein
MPSKDAFAGFGCARGEQGGSTRAAEMTELFGKKAPPPPDPDAAAAEAAEKAASEQAADAKGGKGGKKKGSGKKEEGAEEPAAKTIKRGGAAAGDGGSGEEKKQKSGNLAMPETRCVITGLDERDEFSLFPHFSREVRLKRRRLDGVVLQDLLFGVVDAGKVNAEQLAVISPFTIQRMLGTVNTPGSSASASGATSGAPGALAAADDVPPTPQVTRPTSRSRSPSKRGASTSKKPDSASRSKRGSAAKQPAADATLDASQPLAADAAGGTTAAPAKPTAAALGIPTPRPILPPLTATSLLELCLLSPSVIFAYTGRFLDHFPLTALLSRSILGPEFVLCLGGAETRASLRQRSGLDGSSGAGDALAVLMRPHLTAAVLSLCGVVGVGANLFVGRPHEFVSTAGDLMRDCTSGSSYSESLYGSSVSLGYLEATLAGKMYHRSAAASPAENAVYPAPKPWMAPLGLCYFGLPQLRLE